MEENLQYLLNSRNQCSVTNAPTSSDVHIHIQIQVTFKQAEKLKSRESKEGWMKNDKRWMKNDEWWKMNDEEWWF